LLKLVTSAERSEGSYSSPQARASASRSKKSVLQAKIRSNEVGAELITIARVLACCVGRSVSKDARMSRATAFQRGLALLLGLTALPAVLQLVELGRILVSRLRYPYDAHWIEGGALLHAYRLMHGLPIYPAPAHNADFVPYPYPPFLYVTLALVGKVVGLDYATGRAVSLVAMSAAAAVLAREVYVRFRDLFVPWVWALLTLGGIAAGFPVTGGWYDAALTDPLALGLAVAAGRVLLTDSKELSSRRLWLASWLMLLTVFTKQTYAVLVAEQILFACYAYGRRGVVLGLATAALGGVLLVLTEVVTHGNFLHYVGGQLVRHGAQPHRIWKGLGIVTSFAPYLPFVAVGALFLAFKRALSPSALFWTGMLAAAFPVALLAYAKPAGWNNTFLPIVVLAPAAALLVLADFARFLKPKARALVLAPCALGTAYYLMLQRYPPDAFIVDETRLAAARKLNEFVAGLGGGVLIPARPFLAIRNGTAIEQIHVGGLFDALIAGEKPHFDDFMRRNNPRYVLLTDQEPAAILEPLAKGYFLRGPTPREIWPAQTLETFEFVNRDPTVPLYPGQLLWVIERNPPPPPGVHCPFEFESSAYDGWTVTGDAYASGPARVDAQRDTLVFATQGVVVGVVGASYASSVSSPRANFATGGLRSPAFPLDREILELRVAGSSSPRTRVELWVDNRVRYQASGRGNNYLEAIRWNVAAYRGRSAELAIIDEDPLGHILVDHVCLFGSA
jgi:hypothetical protein